MSNTDFDVRDLLDRAYPTRHEPDDWTDVLARLVGDTNAAEQATSVPPPTRRRAIQRLGRTGVAFAALAAAATALTLTTPWKAGPSLVERAAAAISAANSDQVIYERSTFTNVGPRGKPFGLRRLPRHSSQLWVSGGAAPQTFRSLTQILIPRLIGLKGKVIKAPSAPWGNALRTLHSGPNTQEVGGRLGSRHVIEADVYQPEKNVIVRYTQAPTAISAISFDPIALIRNALTTGHAHAHGHAIIDGQNLQRIELAMRDIDGTTGNATYFVDAQQKPVEIVFHHTRDVRFPYLPIFDPTVPGGVALRFTVFRYLPATPANRRLTSITAQHPTATLVCGTEFGLPDC